MQKHIYDNQFLRAVAAIAELFFHVERLLYQALKARLLPLKTAS